MDAYLTVSQHLLHSKTLTALFQVTCVSTICNALPHVFRQVLGFFFKITLLMFALADCPAETRAYLHGSIQKSSGPCGVRMDPCLLYANAQVRVCFARSLGVWLVRGLDCITVAEEAIGKSPGALVNAGVSTKLAPAY